MGKSAARPMLSMHAAHSTRCAACCRWPLPPLLRASVGCAPSAPARRASPLPARWPWALGAVALNHALLTAAGLWPRSSLARPEPAPAARRPRPRAREVAITIDDGPDPEVTPAVLDLLDAHGARATFFCIAERARRAARRCAREIVARGHSVQNHSDAPSATTSRCSASRGFAREIGARAGSCSPTSTGQRAALLSRAGRAAQPVARRRCCTASACSS